MTRKTTDIYVNGGAAATHLSRTHFYTCSFITRLKKQSLRSVPVVLADISGQRDEDGLVLSDIVQRGDTNEAEKTKYIQ